MKRSSEAERIAALEQELAALRARLLVSEELRASLFQRSPDALFLLGEGIVDCNVQAEQLLGVERAGLLGRSLANFSPPRQLNGIEAQALVRTYLQTALLGQMQSFAWQFLRADGQVLECEVSLSGALQSNPPLVLAVVRDVSARRRAQRLLEEHRRQLHLLVNAMPIQAAYLGVDRIYRSANPLYARFWGRSPAEINGLPMRQVMNRTALAQCDPFIQKVLQGQPQQFEHLLRQGEQVFILNTRYVPEQGSAGAVLGFFLFVEDITERKRTEMALQRSEATFRTLIETTSAALLIYRGRQALFVNRRLEEMTGYSFAELQTDFSVVIDPQDRALALGYAVARLSGQPAPSRYELRLQTRSGALRWVEVSAGVTVFEGQPAGMVTAYDITERKLAESALHASEERYRTLVDSLPEAVAVTDLSGRMVFVSPSGARLFGVQDVREALGRNLLDWLVAADRPRAAQDMEQMLAGHGGKQGIYAAQRDDGSAFYLEVKGEVLHNAQEQPHELLFIGRDITERLEAERRLAYVSTHDALTDIYNRTFFDAEVARLRRREDAFPLSVVMMDLDGLKQANDRLGHSAGDELLRRTARLLGRLVRQGDVLARIGGDEFAILLPRTNGQMADDFSTRLRRGIEAHNLLYPEQSVQLSFGVATAEGPQLLAAVLAAADERMYAEKMARRAKTGVSRPST